MFSKFSEETQKVLIMAKKEMAMLKHPYVGSEHLLLSILHNDNLTVTKILNEYNINYNNYRDEIIKVIGKGNISNNWFLYTPLLKRVLENAILECKEENIKEVTIERVFISLLEEGDGVAIRTLMGMDIDIDALYEKFTDRFIYKKANVHTKLLIDDFAVDFNEKSLNGEFDPVIGRDEKINRVIEILLRRTKNNPLLIGDAGVGKTAIIEELSTRIVNGEVPDQLLNKRILGVSTASLVAGTKYRGEFEERINHIISELESHDEIILFIDEIHTLVGAGGAEGAIDASNILKPYLARGKIKIIGATTKAEYFKFFEQDKALDRRFQKVFIEEPNSADTLNILFKIRNIYEEFHGVKISDEILKSIVDLTDRYMPNNRQPDKAIDILDEACCKTSLIDNDYDKKIKTMKAKLHKLSNEKNECIINQDYKRASLLKNEELELTNKINRLDIKNARVSHAKNITLKILYDIIYARTKIPVYDIDNMNTTQIYNKLKSKILGQDDEIKKIIDVISNRQIFDRKTPSSFLIVGSTGIGKTLFVKEYAKLLYSKESLIRIDMSEYKESHSISKIIGSPPGYVGYDDKNSVLDRIKYNPYSIILLDEIEKADRSVLKLFLQVLDDGYMTNSYGEQIDFSNTIIFMTSNLGCDSKSIGFIDNKKQVILDKINDFLDIEFINRIDEVIMFDSISSKVIEKIIKNKLEKYVTKFNDKKLLSPDFVDKIKNLCEYKKFGARRVDKVIEKEIKNRVLITK